MFDAAFGSGVDIITDFVSGLDRIELDDAIFTAIPRGTLKAGNFVVGTVPGDTNDRILYNAANGRLSYDADGTGATAAIHFATLSGAPDISAGDFVIV
ncbi:hypothetical protein [Methylobrevis pamukkalensis]|uniref:hypothetical protein n=1 Tax=Methylobrevis pamukkalensis TaxID=1439726 RepID=UPI00114D380C|nr:hypothetical protein [Methylobrevis pamukkalensis]